MKKIAPLIAAAALLTLGACATSGTGDSRFDRFDTAQGSLDFAQYDTVFVAPVKASDEVMARVGYRPVGPQDTTRPLTERDLKEQLGRLDGDLRRELGGVVTLVPSPGAGVMTVEVVLTDVQANRATMAELSAEPGLSTRSTYAGGAAADVMFIVDGQTVAMASDRDLERLNNPQAQAGVWGDANRFYRRFAKKVAGLF